MNDGLDKGEPTVENWQALAHHIILQAVEDYRRARSRHKKRPYQLEINAEIQRIEQFFRSEWFSVLCTLDGRRLLSDLKKQMEDTL